MDAVARGRGVLEWGLKRSLLEYLRRTPDLEVTMTGGARFDPDAGVCIPVEPHGEGYRAKGGVVLRAHGGALTVPLVDVRIEGGALTMPDPAGEPGDRVRFVELEGAGPERRWRTRLAPEADALFLYRYTPGEAFDDLVVRSDAGGPDRSDCS